MDWLFDSIFYYMYVNMLYYFCSGMMCLLDLFLIDNKIQDTTEGSIMKIYNKAMPTVLMNTFIYLIPLYLMGGIYGQLDHAEFEWLVAGRDLIGCALLSDFFFYSCHRLFHLEYFYPYHKKHHEIHAPVGVTALYMHPIDLYIGNVIPLICPAVIIWVHPYTFLLWIFITIFNTVCVAHSGFKSISNYHDAHHSLFNKNYGNNIYMDRIFGTYKI